MTILEEVNAHIKAVITILELNELRMVSGTLESGWKYKVSIPLKDYKKALKK